MIDEPKSDAEWQAHCDANTLAGAEEIKADPTRMKAAQTQAIKMAEDKEEEAKAMEKVAGKATGSADDNKSGKRDLSGTSNPFNVGARLRNG